MSRKTGGDGGDCSIRPLAKNSSGVVVMVITGGVLFGLQQYSTLYNVSAVVSRDPTLYDAEATRQHRWELPAGHGDRSRFLATFDTNSCSYTGRCPDIVDPHGFRYPGTQCCDGVCVNTEFDANQCGECNYACPGDDPGNCGGCDNFCWDAGCFNGICGYAV
ncbi:hypothetical protein HU200_054013 [Digitaria exilis]|uniref:Uncharacterized protein n=1 Tax=Digitaria exilis TaxID=1010633 RepID=A0A835AW15_9POAL|nr:hypothetical protein HU200_054013 [Digitaria exilis]